MIPVLMIGKYSFVHHLYAAKQFNLELPNFIYLLNLDEDFNKIIFHSSQEKSGEFWLRESFLQ